MQHEAIRPPQTFGGASKVKPRPAPARPRIVVAGEFGAGKSTVINAMLRRPFLPYHIGATNRPLISLYHAADTGIVVTPWSGDPYELPDFKGIGDPDEVQGLAIRTPMAGLEGSEIVELPFHHDGVVGDGVFELMASADLLIWVTIASQAWRLTEKSVMQRLPTACQARAVLAVSRADKLRSAEDLQKVEARIRRENPAIFSELVFLRAGTDVLTEATADDGAWTTSGGQRLMEIAHAALGEDVRVARALPDHAHADPPTPTPEQAPAAAPAAAPEPAQEATGEVVRFGRDAARLTDAPRAGVPVFRRSQRDGKVAAPAEASSQHVRDVVARDAGGRVADNVVEEIEEILAETTGLDATGIGNFREVQVIKSFRSSSRISVDAMVLATAICLNSAVSASEYVVPEDHIEEVTLAVGPQTFMIVPIDRTLGTFAFFVVQSTRVNPAIMRVLLRRVVALWSEARR